MIFFVKSFPFQTKKKQNLYQYTKKKLNFYAESVGEFFYYPTNKKQKTLESINFLIKANLYIPFILTFGTVEFNFTCSSKSD